jgi:gamma-glutamyltranspeptidase/glutathione hydrolase
MRVLCLLLALLLPVGALAKGGVVTSADPRATAAGQEILREGGSSTDAAIAMMLVLSVVEPQSSGIGGGGFMVHHDGTSGKISTIDGRETAPSALLPNRFMDNAGKPKPFSEVFAGGQSVGIPGNIALAAKAHKKWGKLAWARLFAPAIKLADAGYTLSGPSAAWLHSIQKTDESFPMLQALYWENGAPKTRGSLIKNPEQAKLLRAIAQHGPRAFYTGANAEAIISAAKTAPKNAALITRADLSGYQAKERPAVCAPYHRFKICSMGPPSSGGTTVLQILGLLERFDLKALGRDNPKSWHLLAEAMFLAYADREKWLGDADFVPVPVAGLLDKSYLAARSALISPDKSLDTYAAGTPPGATPRTAALSGENYGTTHFVAVDGAGSITTMTSTVEGPFGSQLVANGMILNNELTDFSFAPEKDGAPVANAPQAGKRPLSSMAPVIVYDAEGKPFLALGSAGGKRIIMHVAKTLIAVLDWGLSAKDAIAEPNIYLGGDAVLIEQGSKLDAMRIPLAQLGKTIVSAQLTSKVNAIERAPQGSAKKWRGAADPRSEGNALDE